MFAKFTVLTVVQSFVAAVFVFLASCSAPQTESPKENTTPPITFQTVKPEIFRFNENAKNSAQAIKAPYVVMISLDGFRYDYDRIHGAKTLQSIARNGVRAEGLIPVYPSKTFPNHYSLVTGLYADEHELVSNEFIDPKTEATYSIGGPSVVEGTWYGGEPLWNTAQKNGFLTASFFWIGSEAPIQGMYPNWYVKYNGAVSADDRINQVMTWLKLPENERPHFISLYFSAVDDAGHATGPESSETKAAVQQVDEVISQLRDQMRATGLPMNLIIVSDHGMEKLDQTKIILLDPSIDLSPYQISGQGTMVKLYLKAGFPASQIDQTVAELRAKQNGPYRVWTRQEMKGFHFSKTRRTGDIIIEPDAPYLVYAKAPSSSVRGGNHGWDPQKFKNMHGIFFAEGPAFKQGVQIKAFENIHIYPLVTQILGLKNTPQVSGKLAVTKDLLR